MSLSYRQMKQYTQAELVRLYKTADPEKIEERRMALMKMRNAIVEGIMIQRREAIEQGGTIKAAVEQQSMALEVALIGALSEQQVARIGGKAQVDAAKVSLIKEYSTYIAGPEAAQTAVLNTVSSIAGAADTDAGKLVGFIGGRQAGDKIDQKKVLDDFLGYADTGLTKSMQTFRQQTVALDAGEMAYAKQGVVDDVVNRWTLMVIEHGKDADGNVVIDPVFAQQYFKEHFAKGELQVSDAEKAGQEKLREESQQRTKEIYAEKLPGVDPDMRKRLDGITSQPKSQTIAEYVQDLDKIPPDPQAVAQLGLIDKQLEKLDTPQLTQFGEFYKLYEAHMDKDALNRIIGVTDDKNAAFIYNYNNDMLQSALAGIGMVGAEDLTDAKITEIRNKIAKGLGMNFIGDIHPVRLRQAMSRRLPLEIPSITTEQEELLHGTTTPEGRRPEGSTTTEPWLTDEELDADTDLTEASDLSAAAVQAVTGEETAPGTGVTEAIETLGVTKPKPKAKPTAKIDPQVQALMDRGMGKTEAVTHLQMQGQIESDRKKLDEVDAALKERKELQAKLVEMHDKSTPEQKQNLRKILSQNTAKTPTDIPKTGDFDPNAIDLPKENLHNQALFDTIRQYQKTTGTVSGELQTSEDAGATDTKVPTTPFKPKAVPKPNEELGKKYEMRETDV